MACEFTGLIKAPFNQSMVMQGYRDQHIRISDFQGADVLAHQLAQNPARREFAPELERLHKAVCGKLILQGVECAGERRCVLNTAAAGYIFGRAQWESALKALGIAYG